MTRIPHSVGEEERNIPLRICLTRVEWDALHDLAVDARLMESSTEGDVYEVVEALVAAVVADDSLIQKIRKYLARS